MKSISNALKTFLLTNPDAIKADLYTIVCKRTNTTFRRTTSPTQIVFGGNTFLPIYPQFKRGSITTMVGLQTDTMDLTLLDDGSTLIDSMTPLVYAQKGCFDNASIRVETVYGPPSGIDVTMGSEIKFIGIVAGVPEVGRLMAKFKVKSLMYLLDAQVPLVIIQPGCNHELFDFGCTLVKASFGVNKIAAGGSTQLKVLASVAYAQASGYFDQGTILFTSGANTGFEYGVKSFDGTGLFLNIPTFFPINAGDTFTVFPGCDKTKSTCFNKFNNTQNFMGMPDVPVPETVL